jgi:hypothetical protein
VKGKLARDVALHPTGTKRVPDTVKPGH